MGFLRDHVLGMPGFYVQASSRTPGHRVVSPPLMFVFARIAIFLSSPHLHDGCCDPVTSGLP